MKVFNNKKTQAEQVDDAEDSLQLKESEQVLAGSSDLLIPVPFKMLFKISREHRQLRQYLFSYCKKNKIEGFGPRKELEVSFNHNENFNSKGQEIAKLTPEEIAENNKPIVPTHKQFSLDDLRKAAKEKQSIAQESNLT